MEITLPLNPERPSASEASNTGILPQLTPQPISSADVSGVALTPESLPVLPVLPGAQRPAFADPVPAPGPSGAVLAPQTAVSAAGLPSIQPTGQLSRFTP